MNFVKKHLKSFIIILIIIIFLLALTVIYFFSTKRIYWENYAITSINDQLNKTQSIFSNLNKEEQDWLKKHPVIKVVQDPGWPPIEFADEKGEPSGIANDYLQLIEKKLDIEFKLIKNLSWQEAYSKLQKWEIDMTTSVAVTPVRTEFWSFTKPYMNIPIVILADSNITYIGNLQELNGKKIAVVDGYAFSEWVTHDYPEIIQVKVNSVKEGIGLLKKNEVFAFVDNMLVIGYYIAKLKLANLKIAGDTPYMNSQSMAVRKDWAIFTDILQKALDSISESEHSSIYKKWVPIRYDHGFDYSLLIRIIIIFILILITLFLWNQKLSKEIKNRKKAESDLKKLNEELENKVEERTKNLALANKELEAFSYSISHDLRAPLRHISGYINILSEALSNVLSKENKRMMNLISDSAKKLGDLIDALLDFSRKNKSKLTYSDIDTQNLVQSIIDDFTLETKDRNISWEIKKLPRVILDPLLLEQVFYNLISNAIKYTKVKKEAQITIDCHKKEKELVFYIKDNGIGFDMKYADKLFGVFQRLHNSDIYAGIGIGLANVKRIIDRFGGRVWAEGKINEGAVFYFSVPISQLSQKNS